MRIEGQTNAWAIGDCAYIVNAFDNKPSPTTAQFAERQGRQAALNLIRILTAEMLRKSSTLAEAIRVLRETPSGELVILDEEQRLWGTLDRSDLFQIVARIAVTPTREREAMSQRKLSEFVQENSVSVALNDSTAVASATMLVRGVTWLPVVQSKDEPRPVGTVRGERIANRGVQTIARTEAGHARAAS